MHQRLIGTDRRGARRLSPSWKPLTTPQACWPHPRALFKVSLVTPDDASQRGEACRSPGRSIPDVLSIVNIEIDGLFQRYGSNPVYGPPNHESYGKRRNSVVQPAFRPASTPVIKLAYKCVAAHRFVHARTWRFRAVNVVSLAVSAHVDSI